MCSDEALEFGARELTGSIITGKRVIEVGARVVQDPSLSLRHHVMELGPAAYVGTDIEEGVGVDAIVPAEDLVSVYGPESFDVVISTELLEHVEDWRPVISAMKQILKPQGTLLVTTRSLGFPYHAWPHDHWRYETTDMQALFSDMEVVTLTSDPKEPGVFMRAVKPERFVEINPGCRDSFDDRRQAHYASEPRKTRRVHARDGSAPYLPAAGTRERPDACERAARPLALDGSS